MADRKPLRLDVGELDTLLAHLRDQRQSLASKIEGITPGRAAWSPVPSDPNLLWPVTYLAAVEEP